MRRRVVVVTAAALLAAGAAAVADGRDSKALKAIGEGRAVYLTHCTGCHGPEARGGTIGTTGSLVPDLTLIAARDGSFDAGRVALRVDGRQLGPRGEMPCWGKAFTGEWPRGEAYAATRILAVTRYLDFIQEPQNAPPVKQ
jgi:mono/diheme cytochrome c family protein